MSYTRKCSNCPHRMSYKTQAARIIADEAKRICWACRRLVKLDRRLKDAPKNEVAQRKCPNCGKVISYSTHQGYEYGERHNSSCRACSRTLRTGTEYKQLEESEDTDTLVRGIREKMAQRLDVMLERQDKTRQVEIDKLYRKRRGVSDAN